MTAAEPELDDVAARALASIILDHTALALADGASAGGTAITELEAATGLNLDVCAGILLATSFLVGAGALTAEAVFAGGLGLDPTGDDDG